MADLIEKNEEQQRINEQAKLDKGKILARRQAESEAEKQMASLRKMRAVSADSYEEERTVWMWKHRIPVGEITLLAGRGGVGKSTLGFQLAAWLSIGDMKGEFEGKPQTVIYVPNEDNPKSYVIPHLRAAGADMSRVKLLEVEDITGERSKLTLPGDMALLRQTVIDENAVLVIMDPISSNLRGKKNDGDEMRPILERLRREICEELRCSILGIAHLRKGHAGDLMEAIMGSSELGNVARAAIGVIEDPDEPDAIILSQEKGNMAPKGQESFRYQIMTHQYYSPAVGGLLSTTKLVWLPPTNVKASDVYADRASGGDGSTNDAVDWLRSFLGQGPKTRKECLDEGRKQHFGERKISSARKQLKVVSYKQFGKEAEWSLP